MNSGSHDDSDDIELPPGTPPLGMAAEVLRLRKNVHNVRGELQEVMGTLGLVQQDIEHVKEGLNRIYTWVQWGVMLIIGAVVLAVLGLVLRGNTQGPSVSSDTPSTHASARP